MEYFVVVQMSVGGDRRFIYLWRRFVTRGAPPPMSGDTQVLGRDGWSVPVHNVTHGLDGVYYVVLVMDDRRIDGASWEQKLRDINFLEVAEDADLLVSCGLLPLPDSNPTYKPAYKRGG